jgi:uncharacterized protein (DUF697 family)
MPPMDNAMADVEALKADNIIKNHIIAAMSVGLVPVPIVDAVAVTLIEVSMITELAAAYHFPVPTRLILYKILISLAGGVGAVYFSSKFHHMIKTLPLVGHAIYVGAFSLSGGISVYAVGKIFQKHFESGGKFLGGDSAEIKKYFAEKREEGEKVVPALIAATNPS